jgi:hypothetical protein
MRRVRRRWLGYFAALAAVPILLFLHGRTAWAQGAPQLDAQIDASTVGVGEMVHLQLSATSADAMPTDPQLGPTVGFVVRGHSSAPAQTHISINGSRMDRYTLTTTWALEARRIGTFHVGPPSVVIGGLRYPSHPVTVTVVAAGQAPRRAPPPQLFPPGMQNPFGPSPFDLWRGLIPGFDNDNQAPSVPSISTDPKLSLDAPRGSFYFLHATVDKSSVVVGEQITFSVYEYIDTGAGRVEIDDEDVHDATAADFVKHPMLREDQEPPLLGYASIAGRTWAVKLVRRWALFPLRAGDLTIGPMNVRMLRPASAAGSQRAAETLSIRAAEPPLAGRPPGYALGDVGRFTLSAQVSPREVEQAAAIGVHVEVSGTGNLPSTIAPPVREGVEWLAPEVHDALGPSGNDAFGGKRTFDFVVRVRRAGQQNLGEMSLPFWNPEQQKYEIARASLGVVSVGTSAAGANPPETALEKPLPDLPPPRDALEGSRAPRVHADDSPIFWIAGVGAWPLAFGAGVAGRAAARRVRSAWHRRRVSPARELRERLAAATTACQKSDARTADAAISRALEAATVAHAGVSVRGALGSEVSERLERAGVAADAALQVADLLRECDAARFAPDAADIVSARGRWARAQGAIRGLEKAG